MSFDRKIYNLPNTGREDCLIRSNGNENRYVYLYSDLSVEVLRALEIYALIIIDKTSAAIIMHAGFWVQALPYQSQTSMMC